MTPQGGGGEAHATHVGRHEVYGRLVTPATTVWSGAVAGVPGACAGAFFSVALGPVKPGCTDAVGRPVKPFPNFLQLIKYFPKFRL
jgi:hypothetical protein